MNIIRLAHADSGLSGYLVLDGTDVPAFGGIRVVPYPDDESCRTDAEHLARAMTRKCAFHGIPGCGGKATIRAERLVDRLKSIQQIARAINDLDGKFYAGPDLGFDNRDIAELATHTPFVSTEDTAAATARGVQRAMEAACDHLAIDRSRSTVIVQGLGSVGRLVALSLIGPGTRVLGWDPDTNARDRARTDGVEIMDNPEVLTTACDIVCPCGPGGVIDMTVARQLECRAIVGAANNILADDSVAGILHERGILFVPDFVANGGGVIRGSWVHLRGTPGTNAEIDAIYSRTRALLARAAAHDVAPLEAAIHARPQHDTRP